MVSRDYGVVSGRWGLRLRDSEDVEGNRVREEQDFLVFGGGAAHSNTQGRGDKSRYNLLGFRKGTEDEGTKGIGDKRDNRKGKRDRRRNLGLPSVAPSLL